MDAPPSLWRQAERLARQGAAQEEVSFTREYERMRPFDEDRHENAIVFTVRRERLGDAQRDFRISQENRAWRASRLLLPFPYIPIAGFCFCGEPAYQRHSMRRDLFACPQHVNMWNPGLWTPNEDA
jgi:hypothetical protein